MSLRGILILIVLLWTQVAVSSELKMIHEVRAAFFQSTVNRSLTEQLHQQLSVSKFSSPVLLGYQGVAEAMMADRVLNPWKKYQHFVAGTETLERALKIEPNNLELRFLRFLVQSKSPRFLGYYSKLEKDKEFLLAGLTKESRSEVPDWLYSEISSYLLASGEYSLSEEASLSQAMK